jgi:hypothetical protein
MYARWGTFVVGMGLVLAPLLLGYQEVGSILHDVTMGVLACVLTLAALELPALRFLNLLPAAWLAWTGHAGEGIAAQAELVGGVLLVVAALVPRARIAPRLAAGERARAGMRA